MVDDPAKDADGGIMGSESSMTMGLAGVPSEVTRDLSREMPNIRVLDDADVDPAIAGPAMWRER